jgi:SAM-dependent methyltransferase
MPRLYSNPWKNKLNFKSKIKYYIRDLFYRWLLKRYCKNCNTVLDVACGPGHFMKTAESVGFKAYGVDADERYKAKNVMIKDLWKMKGKYNVVFNSFILEHMSDQEKFIKRMTELSDDIVITISAYLTKEFYNVPDHTRPVTKVSVRWLFRRNGFRNLLSVHIPFWHAVIVVSKKIKPSDIDDEAKKIRSRFW